MGNIGSYEVVERIGNIFKKKPRVVIYSSVESDKVMDTAGFVQQNSFDLKKPKMIDIGVVRPTDALEMSRHSVIGSQSFQNARQSGRRSSVSSGSSIASYRSAPSNHSTPVRTIRRTARGEVGKFDSMPNVRSSSMSPLANSRTASLRSMKRS